MDVLTQAKENYLPIRRAEVEVKRKGEVTERIWEIPTMTTFPEGATLREYERSIIEPFYTGTLSQ